MTFDNAQKIEKFNKWYELHLRTVSAIELHCTADKKAVLQHYFNELEQLLIIDEVFRLLFISTLKLQQPYEDSIATLSQYLGKDDRIENEVLINDCNYVDSIYYLPDILKCLLGDVLECEEE